MKLWHKLIVAYAIFITALLIGFEMGLRQLARLAQTKPDLTYAQGEPTSIVVRVTTPWLYIGLVAAIVFMLVAPRRKKDQTENQSRTSH